MNKSLVSIRMLMRIPPESSVSQNMEYLKGKSSLKMFDRDANMAIDILGQEDRMWIRWDAIRNTRI